jgi:hypothetical protein
MHLWWVYVVGMAVGAWVIFQAWDTRRNAHCERVDTESARHAKKQRRSDQAPGSSTS